LLVTDHKPLATILSSKASLPAQAAARLQRWAITLSAYNYEIEFHPTRQHANADSLSRLPLEDTPTTDTDKSVTLFNVLQIGTLSVQAKQLHQETANDPKFYYLIRKVGHEKLMHNYCHFLGIS